MKVLYRTISEHDLPAQHELLTRSSLSREGLGLPAEVEDFLLPQLSAANAILPEAMKEFQGWKVALLPLYQPQV